MNGRPYRPSMSKTFQRARNPRVLLLAFTILVTQPHGSLVSALEATGIVITPLLLGTAAYLVTTTLTPMSGGGLLVRSLWRTRYFPIKSVRSIKTAQVRRWGLHSSFYHLIVGDSGHVLWCLNDDYWQAQSIDALANDLGVPHSFDPTQRTSLQFTQSFPNARSWVDRHPAVLFIGYLTLFAIALLILRS